MPRRAPPNCSRCSSMLDIFHDIGGSCAIGWRFGGCATKTGHKALALDDSGDLPRGEARPSIYGVPKLCSTFSVHVPFVLGINWNAVPQPRPDVQ
jgi:hypothetical protein